MEHILVKYEYQPNSYIPYRHYVECSCGFQSRMQTEEAVKGQFDNHLQKNGQEAFFAKQSPTSSTVSEETKAQDWAPFKEDPTTKATINREEVKTVNK